MDVEALLTVTKGTKFLRKAHVSCNRTDSRSRYT